MHIFLYFSYAHQLCTPLRYGCVSECSVILSRFLICSCHYHVDCLILSLGMQLQCSVPYIDFPICVIITIVDTKYEFAHDMLIAELICFYVNRYYN